MLFKACHCPGKASVFGIEKQNQDVYNKDELFSLIARTIITRKFKDFAGEKYKVRMHTVTPSDGEHEVVPCHHRGVLPYLRTLFITAPATPARKPVCG